MTAGVDGKRIAKNTVMLYLRMMFMMLISLYTSRVILDTLGVEDFGIYNVVGGVIVLFSFLNNAMTTATQRFLNFELGKENLTGARNVFSASLIIHLGLGILVLFLGETIGFWFLEGYIVIPQGREYAAEMVLHFTLLGSVTNIMRTPFNAVLIAEERMDLYAYLSVAESILKLVIVFLLSYASFDKLIVYAFLMFLVLLTIAIAYYLCSKKSSNIVGFHFCYSKSLYAKLIGFSGWSLFSSIALVGSTQGISIILNLFYGVVVNAAIGICNQVQSAVMSLVYSFQTAFNPQLVKAYAVGNKKDFSSIILKTSKFSYFLMLILSLPIYISCNDILSFWLVQVPDYTLDFCRLIIIYCIIDALQGPLWSSVQATGKIRNYQLVVSFIIFLTVPLSYVALRCGFTPVYIFLIKVLINILLLLFRLYYLQKILRLSIRAFMTRVLYPCIVVTWIAYILTFLVSLIPIGFYSVFLVVLTSFLINSVLIYTIGLDYSEKILVKLFVKRKLQKHHLMN